MYLGEVVEPAAEFEPDWRALFVVPRRILLAEDDREMRHILAWELRLAGYDVVEAQNGVQLLDLLESSIIQARLFSVDMIISDIRMPGVSGLRVLEDLRRHDAHTPVVLITAFGDQQTHAEARRLGAAAVFDKPFDVDEFCAAVRGIVPPRPEIAEDTAP
jgi:DNA-binding response OmpR family regulator